jgi:hypothetical protein
MRRLVCYTSHIATPHRCLAIHRHRLSVKIPSICTEPPAKGSLNSVSRSFHSNTKMSDADYEAFLNKANEDVGGASTKSKPKDIGIKSIDTKVPKSLELIKEFFVSESDEPFEPVSLTFKGSKLPSEGLIVFSIFRQTNSHT